MALPHEKQGYLEDLSKKTTIELKELLNRQESLLKKKKFLSTLPDKGEKVHKFKNLLIKLITDREESEQRIQHRITETLDRKNNKNEQDREGLTGGDSVMKKPSRFAQKRKEIQIKNQKDMHPETSQIDVLTVELSGSMNTSDQTSEDDKMGTNKDFNALRDKSEQIISGLEDSLQNMNIEEDYSNQEEDGATFTSYEIKTIKKFNKNSTYMNTKFKPNCSLKNKNSDRPSSDAVTLTEESYVMLPTNAADNHTKRNRDLALEGPMYKYNKSKLISLEDSIHLQTAQKKISEEIQAKHAAERLAERLNITMETYNPEGTDMLYRENATEMDSDDDDDDDGDDNDDKFMD